MTPLQIVQSLLSIGFAICALVLCAETRRYLIRAQAAATRAEAAAELAKATTELAPALQRVQELAEQPDYMDAQHPQPQGYLHGYRVAIGDAKRAATISKEQT